MFGFPFYISDAVRIGKWHITWIIQTIYDVADENLVCQDAQELDRDGDVSAEVQLPWA